jgi:hypothetical protein
MSSWVIYIRYLAIVGFREGATREDMCRSEAGGFLDAVEKQDLVGWGDEKNAKDSQRISRLVIG